MATHRNGELGLLVVFYVLFKFAWVVIILVGFPFLFLYAAVADSLSVERDGARVARAAHFWVASWDSCSVCINDRCCGCEFCECSEFCTSPTSPAAGVVVIAPLSQLVAPAATGRAKEYDPEVGDFEFARSRSAPRPVLVRRISLPFYASTDCACGGGGLSWRGSNVALPMPPGLAAIGASPRDWTAAMERLDRVQRCHCSRAARCCLLDTLSWAPCLALPCIYFACAPFIIYCVIEKLYQVREPTAGENKWRRHFRTQFDAAHSQLDVTQKRIRAWEAEFNDRVLTKVGAFARFKTVIVNFFGFAADGYYSELDIALDAAQVATLRTEPNSVLTTALSTSKASARRSLIESRPHMSCPGRCFCEQNAFCHSRSYVY